MTGWLVSVADFLRMGPGAAHDQIRANCPNLTAAQDEAWGEEVEVLQVQLAEFREAHLIFEYVIPRTGDRIDAVLIDSGMVFVLEFKTQNSVEAKPGREQCLGYALALKNFHEVSRDPYIVPVLIPASADPETADLPLPHANEPYYDRVFAVTVVRPDYLGGFLRGMVDKYGTEPQINPASWRNSRYHPIPSIIKAAQAAYRGHGVDEIGTPEDRDMLVDLVLRLSRIIDYSKEHGKKSVCFVTGIPGSGKTLAGLELVARRRDVDKEEDRPRSLFLSGNRALVDVLHEALAQDDHHRNKEDTSINQARQKVTSFMQHMFRYRNSFLADHTKKQIENVIVFDEAQRAWNRGRLSQHVRAGHGSDMSEPELVLDMLARHHDWAVLVCLVGDGQAIKKDEVGMGGWFEALNLQDHTWDVHLPEGLREKALAAARQQGGLVERNLSFDEALHLDRSLRTFKDAQVTEFINRLVDRAGLTDVEESRNMIAGFEERYPIRVTRDIDRAKAWVARMARHSQSRGIIAHHKSDRLRPYGVCMNERLDVKKWFLDGSDSIHSSGRLEEAANQYQTQGLELDWTCVCWDANLRHGDGWRHNAFRGSSWTPVGNPDEQRSLENSYRVLLTRARQGMVIFVPRGDVNDDTRKPEYYDGIYEYLVSMGIRDVGDEEYARYVPAG